VRDSINISLKKFELIVPSIINKNQNFIINNLPANSSLNVFDALGQIVYQSNNYQNNFMPLMANAVYLVELVYDVGGASKIKERYNGKLLIIE
jgi:enoyl-[acyl-carrier-protein] reductase (NADH)